MSYDWWKFGLGESPVFTVQQVVMCGHIMAVIQVKVPRDLLGGSVFLVTDDDSLGLLDKLESYCRLLWL